jgi:hypothetical protein
MDDKSLHRTDPHSPSCYCYYVDGAVSGSGKTTWVGGSLSLKCWSGAAGAAGLKNSDRRQLHILH